MSASRKHRARSGPVPTVSARLLMPISVDDATVLAALALAEIFESPEVKRLGRPPVDAWDICIAGLIMGMTGLSARAMSSGSGLSHRTISRRLAGDLLPMLERLLNASGRLASGVGSRETVVVQSTAPTLPQLVSRVGVGRARRRNDHGLLVDALLRSIAVNMKLYAEQTGLFSDGQQAGTATAGTATAGTATLSTPLGSAPDHRPGYRYAALARAFDVERRRGRLRARSTLAPPPIESTGKLALAVLQPQRRADCKHGRRPCPWSDCRHNLDSDLASCTLDVVDGIGAATRELIAEVIGLSRERVRQIEGEALARMRKRMPASEYGDRGDFYESWGGFDDPLAVASRR